MVDQSMLSRDTVARYIEINKEEIHDRNWVMRLWRPSPTLCWLQGEKQESQGIIQSEVRDQWCTCWSPKAQELGALSSEGRRWMSWLKKRENQPSLCLFVPLGPNGLDDTAHIGEGGSSLFSLRNQMLVSPIPADTCRNTILPTIRASLGPVKLEKNWHTSDKTRNQKN